MEGRSGRPSRGVRSGTIFLVLLLLFAVLTNPPTATLALGQPAIVRELVAGNLEWPVSLAFPPDGQILYNERFTGKLRAIAGSSPVGGELGNVSVVADGEQGLLGLALDPDFETNPWAYVYHTYFNASAGRAMNRVSRLTIGLAPSPPVVILDGIPAGTFHNGGIIAFAPDGMLFVTTGDALNPAASQDPGSLAGKVLRLHRDGRRPADNPIPGSYAYTIGHRNIFGLAFHPETGRAYISENGPVSNDEINFLEPGGNYGWPHVTGIANDARYVDPIVVYADVIAPTGIAFLENDLFLGDWNRGVLQRIALSPPEFRRVLGNETIDRFPANGILDVEAGPDGALYVSTPDAIYRLRLSIPAGLSLALLVAVLVLVSGAGIGVWVLASRTRRS